MHAHTRTFFTTPGDHGNCSVGEYTHGLVEAGDILDREDVGALLEVGWVTMEAFAGVAALERRPSSIVYGPLADTSHDPDVVLLRLSPYQAMELGDATSIHLSGKPQCQILPIAIGLPYTALVPVIAKDTLGAAPGEFGLLMSAAGFGSLIAGFALASMGPIRRGGALLIVIGLLFGVSVMVLGLSTAYAVAFIAACEEDDQGVAHKYTDEGK